MTVGAGHDPPGQAVPDVPAAVTPDAVALELETATVGSRAVAYMIDLAVLLAGALLIGLAEGLFGVSGFVPGWVGLLLLLILGFVWIFGYPVGFETLTRGRTPGKMALGLRVVTVEGAPVAFRHATVRAVVGLFELLATLGAVAVVSSLASTSGRRLGDLAAGTMVIRERRARRHPSAEVFAPPAGMETYVARLDVSALGTGDYATVRDTLRRAPSLPPHVQERVSAHVAESLRGRIAPPPPPGTPPLVFLACVAAAVQARRLPAPVRSERDDGWGVARLQPQPPPAPARPAAGEPRRPGGPGGDDGATGGFAPPD